MFVLELKDGVTSAEKGNKPFKYLSIGVLIGEEIEELERKFFGSKEQSILKLIEVSQKREKKFEFHAEYKTETSKKGNEYSYLSVQVPLNGEYVEVYKHFFNNEQKDACEQLIHISELEYVSNSKTDSKK